MTFIRNNK